VIVAAGYPVHVVTRFCCWTNPHKVRFTTWRADCQATETDSGHAPWKNPLSARRKELCPVCFPGQFWRSPRFTADPVEVQTREDV
jgi:hypothetical protein